ncbi:MAG: ATP-binding protein [Flavobacteriales bacterium]
MESRDGLREGTALAERVKELSCLYEIASIGAMHHSEPQEALEKIVRRLPMAWMFADLAVAEISIDNQYFISGNIPDPSITQSATVTINHCERGLVRIHYPSSKETYFLEEEQHLIEMIAQEIAVIVERVELRQKEKEFESKMQRSDRLGILGEITAGIAHELNTPLANILGFSQFIRSNADELQIQKDADKIIQSTMYAREVVKKLMLFSCDIPGDIKESNINETVSNALKLLKPTIQEAHLELEIDEDPNDVVASIDSVQITQLVFNLVINAIHASRPHGKINVRIKSNKDAFVLEVEDKGYGIPDEVQSKMFEPFFTTKQPGEGSGLGLSVVHGIVKSHGGDIDVKSQEGMGTRFVIQIPLSK